MRVQLVIELTRGNNLIITEEARHLETSFFQWGGGGDVVDYRDKLFSGSGLWVSIPIITIHTFDIIVPSRKSRLHRERLGPQS